MEYGLTGMTMDRRRPKAIIGLAKKMGNGVIWIKMAGNGKKDITGMGSRTDYGSGIKMERKERKYFSGMETKLMINRILLGIKDD